MLNKLLKILIFVLISFIVVVVVFLVSLQPVHPKLEWVDLEDYLYTIQGEVVTFNGERKNRLFDKQVDWFIADLEYNGFFYKSEDKFYFLKENKIREIKVDGILSDVQLASNKLMIVERETLMSKAYKFSFIDTSHSIEVDSNDYSFNGQYLAYVGKGYQVFLYNITDNKITPLPLKTYDVLWSQDNLIVSNGEEIQRYNIKTGELETLIKQKLINSLTITDSSGRYLIFSAKQERGLGIYDVYFLADLVDKSVKTLELGSGIYPVGWLTREEYDKIISEGVI